MVSFAATRCDVATLIGPVTKSELLYKCKKLIVAGLCGLPTAFTAAIVALALVIRYLPMALASQLGSGSNTTVWRRF